MDFYLTIAALILGFTFSNITIPAILKVANAKNIFEPFEERRLHNSKVPPLGGIAVFAGFVLATVIASGNIATLRFQAIFAALLMLFLIGLKDDLINVRAYKKIIVQCFAALLIVLLGKLRFTGLNGLFGFNELGFWTGLSFSVLFIVTVINAFNLVDGIDGLASGLAILAATFLGSWFNMAGFAPFAIVSFALVGSLLGFFIYNVFSVKNKIFLGDTGSLVTGAIIAILLIRFINGTPKVTPLGLTASPAIAFAIICIPLIDTLRVVTIRILLRQSPFTPDKNHIHHRLLQLMPNHGKVTGVLVATNLLFIIAAAFMTYSDVDINIQFFILLTSGIILSFVPSWLLRARSSKKTLQTSKG
ncbi:MAG TPA: MraY family glycosyltransferase [Draconibacterium sp.]|nr:MraY family glycosyltransferase [Draconibacterium sp.]